MAEELAPDLERLRRLKSLLEEALDLPEPERARWLGTLSTADRPLAPTLGAMLARASRETDSFMARPLHLGLDEADAAPADQPGDLVGPYRLQRELGAGGMARVWLADRVDGKLNRLVALKLPSAGFAPGLAPRMARERDLLATLEHPGIARLYDAGVTPAGRPWLAMEWVDGRPIDEHCRQQDLGIDERLRLFLQVAEAVAHAHARLIVHRDLKPANVLVGTQGRVVLLDFGVAKLLADPRPGAELTQRGGRVLTPAYASPEQVAGAPLGVASDVYSLGVLLFELLAGDRPYRPECRSGAALEEAVLAADVGRASEHAAAAGAGRASVRRLRGDLDNILAKALQREPGQRYSSVEAFAADVQRHLQGLPVAARPASRRLRLRKFVGRNRLAVALSAALLVALGSGLALVLWQARQTALQGELAKARFRQSAAALQFTKQVLTDGLRADETLTLEALMRRAEAMARAPELARRPAGAQAAQVVATWYAAAELNDRAEKLLSAALATPQAGADRAFVDDLRCSRAMFRARLGRTAEALPEFDEVIARVAGTDAFSAMKCLQGRAEALGESNDLAGSLRDSREAIRQYERLGVEMDETMAELKAMLGLALFRRGQPVAAVQAFAESAARLDAAGANEGSTASDLHGDWGLALESAGDPQRALDHLMHSAELNARHSPTEQDSPTLVANLAGTLSSLGRPAECVAASERALAMLAGRQEPSVRVYVLGRQVPCLVALGRLGDAAQAVQQASALATAAGLGDAATSVKWLHFARAQLLAERGRLDEAESELAKLQAVYDRVGGRTMLVQQVLLARADIAGRQGRWPQALALAARGLEIARTNQGELHHSAHTGRALLAVAQAQAGAGQVAPAREACTQALEHLVPMLGEAHEATRQARQLAQALG